MATAKTLASRLEMRHNGSYRFGWTQVPRKLTDYRAKFKVIGKNLFVRVPTKDTKPVASRGSMTVAEARNAFTGKITLDQVLSAPKLASTMWVIATPQQREECNAARIALETYLVNLQIKTLAYRASRADRQVTKARKELINLVESQSQARAKLEALLREQAPAK